MKHVTSICFQQQLKRLNALLDPLPGFEIFSSDDILRFLEQPSCTSLHFKKETGKGYLYGLELAHLRQALFNEVPQSVRCDIFRQKLCHVGLDNHIVDFVQVGYEELIDVTDIGMGHSVYRCDFSNNRSVVVKQTGTHYPHFYSQVLQRLQWPYIPLVSYDTSDGVWTLSEYVPGHHLTHHFNTEKVTEHLVIQLAQQACLGDVLGRGDRHFENYLWCEDVLYPMDVSYLFYPDNETWVDRYVKGGQSESCVEVICSDYTVFWTAYDETFQWLTTQQKQLEDVIGDHFSPDQAKIYNAYIVSRLHQEDYVQRRNQACRAGLDVFRIRQEAKLRLQEVIAQDEEILGQDPLLWMYYHADRGRMTAFFLMDYFNRHYILDLF